MKSVFFRGFQYFSYDDTLVAIKVVMFYNSVSVFLGSMSVF